MAMSDLYTLHFSQYGDKHPAAFWTAWKDVVRKCGCLVQIRTMLQLLVRQLAKSHALKDEIRNFRKAKVSQCKYDELAKIIHQKIVDIDLEAHADAQLL